MSKVIHKQVLNFDSGTQELPLPRNAQIVHIALQSDGTPAIWFMRDPTEKSVETRTFKIVGTGQGFGDDMRHVGTFLDGSFVWHVLEKTE